MMPIPSTRRLEADRTLGFQPSAEHRSNQDRVRQCVSHGVAEHDLGHVIGGNLLVVTRIAVVIRHGQELDLPVLRGWSC